MSRDPFERWLGRELGSLPRQAASAGFSRRVLAAYDERRARSWMAAGWRRSAVGALAVVLVASGALFVRERVQQGARVREARELRLEYRQLEMELERLRASAASEAPMIRLGSDEELELVMDLAPLLRPALRPDGSRSELREAAQTRYPE